MNFLKPPPINTKRKGSGGEEDDSQSNESASPSSFGPNSGARIDLDKHALKM
jgi:hypothetical protein